MCASEGQASLQGSPKMFSVLASVVLGPLCNVSISRLESQFRLVLPKAPYRAVRLPLQPLYYYSTVSSFGWLGVGSFANSSQISFSHI